ncbi:hypothetical protein OC845_002063 [Tilletia horrida]|nr:hypothetical protein OC845_002063 [Tilletia horrida]
MANGGTTQASPLPSVIPHNMGTTATATAATATGAPASTAAMGPSSAPTASTSTLSAFHPPLPGIVTSALPPSSAAAALGPMSPSVHVTDWSEQHVSQWLQSLGVGHLVSAFRDHGINGDSLVLLDDDNLQEIGVNSVGQRLALLGEIFRLKETFDIPIEEGDYVPHSAYPGLPLPGSSTSESGPALTGMLGAIQQRDDRISALESELSKVTTYLNRLQHDFAQVCVMIGLKHPSSHDAPPIFPFSPVRPESVEPGLLLQPSEKLAHDVGLSTSQSTSTNTSLLAQLPVAPTSATPSSAPPTARTTPASASSTSSTAPPLTSRTTSTSRDSAAGPAKSVAGGSSKPGASVAAPVAALANAVGPTATGLPGFGSTDTDNSYRSFRVTLEDPCYRVLPAALRKYKINDDWKKYALIICHGNTERCVTYEEKPLLLFQKLKESKQNPIFMLRHIRDVKNPIALAKAKAEARTKSPATATGMAGTGAHVVKVPLADVRNSNAASASSAAAAADTDKAVDGQSPNATGGAEDTSASSLNKSPGGSKRNKVAERVARFEGNATSARPAPSANATRDERSTASSSTADTNKGSVEKDKDAEDVQASSSSAVAKTSGGSTSKSSGGSGHTFVVLGSKEWATAMAVRALRNGHDPSKPVLTGAATRLPAASPSATTTNASTSASTAPTAKDGASKNGAASGAETSGSASPNAAKKYAIAIYPYTSERDDEFDVELGDTFVVLNKIHGWWAVERDPRADGEGDGQVVEVDAPSSPNPSSKETLSLAPTGKMPIKVVWTGWVPAGCLLEMSKPLAGAVPNFKEKINAASTSGQGASATATGASSADEEKAATAGEEIKDGTSAEETSSLKVHPPMAIFPIPPSLITSPSTPGVMLMDYTSPPEDRLSLKKGDRLRVFKRYSHWSYCVQESGLNGRGWIPSWYIGKASSSTGSSSSRRAGGSSRLGTGHRTSSSSKISSSQSTSATLSVVTTASTSGSSGHEQSKRSADAAGLSNRISGPETTEPGVNGSAPPPTSAAKTLSAGLASATGGTMSTGLNLSGPTSTFAKAGLPAPPGVHSSSNGMSAAPSVSSSGNVPAASTAVPSGVVATVHGSASGSSSNNPGPASTAAAAG